MKPSQGPGIEWNITNLLKAEHTRGKRKTANLIKSFQVNPENQGVLRGFRFFAGAGGKNYHF